MTAEIELAGGKSFQENIRDVCRRVRRGRVCRIVHLQTGRHRGWFTRERPDGCEPVRITIWALGRAPGQVFDDIRGGAVYQVWDVRQHEPVGYIYWAAEPWLAELLASCPMTYVYRSRFGNVIKRDICPLAVQAERPRRAVLAGG